MAKLEEVEGLEQALKDHHTAGHTAGHAEGYAKGRADAVAILTAKGASNAPELAAELAADPAISAERASSIIGKAPAKGAGDYRQAIAGASPDVGPNVDTEAQKKAARIEQLRAIGKSVR